MKNAGRPLKLLIENYSDQDHRQDKVQRRQVSYSFTSSSAYFALFGTHKCTRFYLPSKPVVLYPVIVKDATVPKRSRDLFKYCLTSGFVAFPDAPLEHVLAARRYQSQHLVRGVVITVKDVLNCQQVPIGDIGVVFLHQEDEVPEAEGQLVYRHIPSVFPKN